jgi:hypothetical protein
VAKALAVGSAGRAFRSRSAQRIRNHVAILRSIDQALRIGQPLRSSAVLRWYTSISSGLSTTALDAATMTRLDLAVRRINSPQLRLQPAVQEIATLHASLLADPLVPSFNGILSRLLLHFHLGRCKLSPILFDPTEDPARMADERRLLAILLPLIQASLE